MNDELLLKTIAEKMFEIDPQSSSGAPVLISQLRPSVESLFSSPDEFDAALIRMERAGKLSLLRYDPAFYREPTDPKKLVSDGKLLYSGVSLN